MAEAPTAGEPLRVEDDEAAVTVRKVHTGTGERAEVVAERLGQAIRLDAIALESLSWQPPGEVGPGEEAGAEPSAAVGSNADPPGGTAALTISNEYALARLERVAADRLAVSAPKLGYRLEVGPRELEWLTRQSPHVFTEWLATPFGPDAEHPDR